jgi:hypothetical protein
MEGAAPLAASETDPLTADPATAADAGVVVAPVETLATGEAVGVPVVTCPETTGWAPPGREPGGEAPELGVGMVEEVPPESVASDEELG